MYNLSMSDATKLMSITTISCGIFGTIAGSLVLDASLKQDCKNWENGKTSYETYMFISVEKSSFMMFLLVFLATGVFVAASAVAQFLYYVIGFCFGIVFVFG